MSDDNRGRFLRLARQVHAAGSDAEALAIMREATGLSFTDVEADRAELARRAAAADAAIAQITDADIEARLADCLTGAGYAPPPPRFTCPRCGKGSSHPDDARFGYCAVCRDWTDRTAPEAPPEIWGYE